MSVAPPSPPPRRRRAALCEMQVLTVPLSRVRSALLVSHLVSGLVSLPAPCALVLLNSFSFPERTRLSYFQALVLCPLLAVGPFFQLFTGPSFPAFLRLGHISCRTPLASRPRSGLLHCASSSCAFLWVPLITHALASPSALHISVGCPALPGR